MIVQIVFADHQTSTRVLRVYLLVFLRCNSAYGAQLKLYDQVCQMPHYSDLERMRRRLLHLLLERRHETQIDQQTNMKEVLGVDHLNCKEHCEVV